MAGAYGSAVSFSISGNQFAIYRIPPPLSVSASVSPKKLARRKNHLRIKILKTLTKSPPPFTVTPIPLELPEISGPVGVETVVSSPAESCPSSSTAADGGESRLSGSSSTASLLNFDVAKFSWGSFLRFGAYFLAVFAFQTICTVWVLEYGNSIKEDKNSEEGSNVKSKIRREVLLNGNERIVHGNFGSKTGKLVYLDESKTREKIEEIRAMAREARNEEKNRSSDDFGDDDSEDRNAISKARIGIEKEVDSRLVKLQKRLNSARERIPELPVNYLLKSETVNEEAERSDLNGEEKNKGLVFKKKLKYRNSSGDRMQKPKGFRGSVSNGKKGGSNSKGTTMEDAKFNGDNMGMKDEGTKESVSKMPNGDGTNTSNESVLQSQSDRKISNTEVKGLKNKPNNGVFQETSSVEISKSQNSRDLEVKMSPSAGPNGNVVGKKSIARVGRGKQSKKEANLWWLNLPYVLVIFMRRGSDDEELEGLFTLKIPSKTQDTKESTYTVAFEDHADANNFCYLLESFFEELGNFRADIVPLATKELEKVMKSHTNKIIVVKKGQLKLYVGQPFADVEMALHALAEGNENVISLHPI